MPPQLSRRSHRDAARCAAASRGGGRRVRVHAGAAEPSDECPALRSRQGRARLAALRGGCGIGGCYARAAGHGGGPGPRADGRGGGDCISRVRSCAVGAWWRYWPRPVCGARVCAPRRRRCHRRVRAGQGRSLHAAPAGARHRRRRRGLGAARGCCRRCASCAAVRGWAATVALAAAAQQRRARRAEHAAAEAAALGSRAPPARAACRGPRA
jgi:hypothetical protein